jgi:NAD+ diphosphatase
MQHTSFWIVRYKQEILIDSRNPLGPNFLPHADYLDGNHSEPIMVGYWQGLPCYATDTRSAPENFDAELVPLRQVFGVAGPEAFAMAGRASQLIDWQLNHQYCGRCAHQTRLHDQDFAMHCDQCGLNSYPRISPAVMVLVRRQNELLLARSPHFKPGVFSALAGFVEAGETLEQCAMREVKEEVGIEISHLRYFSSQSWPFPNSLMVAFFAEYAGGELTPDPNEIEAADWFTLDALPRLPDPVSIARRLIEGAIAQMQS